MARFAAFGSLTTAQEMKKAFMNPRTNGNSSIFSTSSSKEGTSVQARSGSEKKYHGNILSNPHRLLIFFKNRPLLFMFIGYVLLSLQFVDYSGIYKNVEHTVEHTIQKLRVCDQDLAWDMASIARKTRDCRKPNYEVIPPDVDVGKVCLVTLTDDSFSDKSYKSKHNCRDFSNVMQITWDNRKDYARKHGYHLYDKSDKFDMSRPPGWSKLHAVNSSFHDEHCNWTMWLDADTLIMNSAIKVEDILPADPDKQFLVAIDFPNKGWNSGVWIIRNTDWSHGFLDSWWNKRSFVRRPGLSKSGDNAALGSLLTDMPDFDKRIGVPPRCNLNSFTVFLNPNVSKTIESDVTNQVWYMNENYYHKGDYIAHVAGLDNKAGPLKALLKEAV